MDMDLVKLQAVFEPNFRSGGATRLTFKGIGQSLITRQLGFKRNIYTGSKM
jgi:hypothetical protein